MKYLALLMIFAFGCAKTSTPSSQPTASSSADVLVQTEATFSRMSEDSGFHAALIAYMAPDATKLIDGAYPIIGGDSIKAVLNARPDSAYIMTWKARHADIASSGDLGYTWGDWFFRAKHPKAGDSLYGNYYTIWKKQSDGSWKWVLDGGNKTPGPPLK